MTEDARFADGADKPLRLKALDVEDLAVISSLVQDAVFPATEMLWTPRQRRFAMLINRFRWEDVATAARAQEFERVQAVLAFEDVLKVRSQGLVQGDKDTVLSILSLAFEPGEGGTGTVVITLAGDGAIAIDVEALEVVLRDVTRPYVAPSHKAPTHD